MVTESPSAQRARAPARTRGRLGLVRRRRGGVRRRRRARRRRPRAAARRAAARGEAVVERPGELQRRARDERAAPTPARERAGAAVRAPARAAAPPRRSRRALDGRDRAVVAERGAQPVEPARGTTVTPARRSTRSAGATAPRRPRRAADDDAPARRPACARAPSAAQPPARRPRRRPPRTNVGSVAHGGQLGSRRPRIVAAMDVCTIIAKNYLAYARVLARSFARAPPGRALPRARHRRHRGLHRRRRTSRSSSSRSTELEIERFERMAALYDVLELSTAVKPWLLRHLLDARGATARRLPRPRHAALRAARRDVRALCASTASCSRPHNLGADAARRPQAERAGHPDRGRLQPRLRRASTPGAFADALLDWWAERLETDCIVDPERGFFVDQRWMDFAPGHGRDFHLLRDPGFNVAYWNLPRAPVARATATLVRSTATPAAASSTSAASTPRARDQLSKHQDRIQLGDAPGLRELCDELRRRAAAPTGVDEAPRLAVHVRHDARRASPLDRRMRRALPRARRGELRRARRSTPDGRARRSSTSSTRRRAVGGEPASRATWRRCYEQPRRPAARLPRPRRRRRRRASSAGRTTFGRARGADPRRAAARARRARGAPAPAAAPAPLPLGVNVAGYLTLGARRRRGRAPGRSRALDAAGVPVAAGRARRRRTAAQGHAFAGADGASAPATRVNLVCVNADMLPPFADDVGPAFFADRYTIGCGGGRSRRSPSAGCGVVRARRRGLGRQPLRRRRAAPRSRRCRSSQIPMPVRACPRRPRRAARALGLPDGFLFLFVVRLQQRLRAQEPARRDRRVHARVPGRRARARRSSSRRINAEHHPADHERLRRGGRGARRTST